MNVNYSFLIVVTGEFTESNGSNSQSDVKTYNLLFSGTKEHKYEQKYHGKRNQKLHSSRWLG